MCYTSGGMQWLSMMNLGKNKGFLRLQWWLQQLFPTPWAQRADCAWEVRSKERRREEKVAWKASPHHIIMLYLNLKLWKRPRLLAPSKMLFHCLSSSSLSWVLLTEKLVWGSVCISHRQHPALDLEALCLHHGSKLVRNSAFKTSSNTSTKRYF